MILNLERQVSNSPVLNLDAVAPGIELRLNDFATSPCLEIQAFQWPESSGIQNIPIPWAELRIIALVIAAGGVIWISSQIWNNIIAERHIQAEQERLKLVAAEAERIRAEKTKREERIALSKTPTGEAKNYFCMVDVPTFYNPLGQPPPLQKHTFQMTDVNLNLIECRSGGLLWFGHLKEFSKSICNTQNQPPTLPCLIIESMQTKIMFENEAERDEFFSELTTAVSAWKEKYVDMVVDNQVPSSPTSDQAIEEVQVNVPSPPKIATEAVVETKEALQDANAAQLVMQLLDYATKDDGNLYETQIQELKQKIDGLPKPIKGQKKLARAINEQALSLFNNGQLEEAVKLFNAASQLDKSDPEILNNLGYALLKQGNIEPANVAILETLAISPGRATAWQNLGDILAIKNDMPRAIAAYENVYRFSKNRVKTHQFMQKLNANDVSILKNARQTAMDWAEKMFVDESLQQILPAATTQAGAGKIDTANTDAAKFVGIWQYQETYTDKPQNYLKITKTRSGGFQLVEGFKDGYATSFKDKDTILWAEEIYIENADGIFLTPSNGKLKGLFGDNYPVRFGDNYLDRLTDM